MRIVAPLRDAARSAALREALDAYDPSDSAVASIASAETGASTDTNTGTGTNKHYRDYGPALPFDLLGKQFWPLSALSTALQHVQENASTGERFFSDARRLYAIDGLLFTRNERGIRTTPDATERVAVSSGAQDGNGDGNGNSLPSVLKWKYADLHSIDLRLGPIDPASGDFALACATQRGEVDVVWRSQFEQADAERLQMTRPGSIVEVAYNTETQRWLFVGVREKPEPNYLNVLLDTMLAAQERIALQELCMLLAAPATAEPARRTTA